MLHLYYSIVYNLHFVLSSTFRRVQYFTVIAQLQLRILFNYICLNRFPPQLYHYYYYTATLRCTYPGVYMQRTSRFIPTLTATQTSRLRLVRVVHDNIVIIIVIAHVTSFPLYCIILYKSEICVVRSSLCIRIAQRVL